MILPSVLSPEQKAFRERMLNKLGINEPVLPFREKTRLEFNSETEYQNYKLGKKMENVDNQSKKEEFKSEMDITIERDPFIRTRLVLRFKYDFSKLSPIEYSDFWSILPKPEPNKGTTNLDKEQLVLRGFWHSSRCRDIVDRIVTFLKVENFTVTRRGLYNVT